jgi:hypothetical protein
MPLGRGVVKKIGEKSMCKQKEEVDRGSQGTDSLLLSGFVIKKHQKFIKFAR